MPTIDFEPQREDGAGRAPEWAAARRALAQALPPDSIEAALLLAHARRYARQPWYRRWSLDGFASGAAIASVGWVLAMVLGVLLAPPRQAGMAGMAAQAVDDGFLSLATPEQIAAAVDPQLKRADLPRQALVQMGIPIGSDAPDEMIHAELLVAASGQPLAIRLAVN